MSCGTPPELLIECNNASIDEINHTKYSFYLANKYKPINSSLIIPNSLPKHKLDIKCNKLVKTSRSDPEYPSSSAFVESAINNNTSGELMSANSARFDGLPRIGL